MVLRLTEIAVIIPIAKGKNVHGSSLHFFA